MSESHQSLSAQKSDTAANAGVPADAEYWLALIRLPEIERIEIGARVKPTRRRRGPNWEARISAVHWYLVDRGVPSERLQLAAPQVLARGEAAPEGLTFTIVARRAGR